MLSTVWTKVKDVATRPTVVVGRSFGPRARLSGGIQAPIAAGSAGVERKARRVDG